jgi:hypothetical protein
MKFEELLMQAERSHTRSRHATHGRHLPQGDSVKIPLLLAMATVLSLGAVAQTNPQTTMAVEPMNQTPTFRVNVISRSVKAIKYKHRGGATKLDFAGTDLKARRATSKSKSNSAISRNPRFLAMSI